MTHEPGCVIFVCTCSISVTETVDTNRLLTVEDGKQNRTGDCLRDGISLTEVSFTG